MFVNKNLYYFRLKLSFFSIILVRSFPRHVTSIIFIFTLPLVLIKWFETHYNLEVTL